MSFWGYDVGKLFVQKVSTGTCSPTSDLSIAQFFAAGLCSAVPMTSVSAPLERLKILLQVQGQNLREDKHNEKAPRSATAILGGLYREGGVRSI